MSYRATKRLVEGQIIKRGESPWQDAPDWFYPCESKRPKNVYHQIGKNWIYVANNVKVLASRGQLELIYFKDEEKKFLPIVQNDNYFVTKHSILGRNHIFGEFQVTESGNEWDKDYPRLFREFAEDEQLTLMVVTTGTYQTIKDLLLKQMKPFQNVRLEFYTLDRIRDFCWRVALEMREKYRQQQVLSGRR